MNKLILICFFAIILIGCSYDSKDQIINGIPINLDQKDNVSIKQIFSKIDLIPLETSSKVFIKRANKIVYNDGKYYVLDIAQHSIFIFDDKGKFLYKIQKATHGLALYETIRDFEINPFNNTIELLSPNGVVFVYDINGNYQSTFRLNGISAVEFFEDVSKDVVVFYSMFEPKRIIYFSRSTNKIFKSTYEIPEFLTRRTSLNSSNSPFSKFKNKFLLSTVFSNAVYVVRPDDIKVKYTWDFGKYNFNIKDLPPNESGNYYHSFFQHPNFAYDFFFNTETEKKIFTGIRFRGKQLNLIYDKLSGTYKLFEQFSEGINYPHLLIPFDGGVFAVVDPSDISENVKPGLLDKPNNETLKNIKLTDNPVIIKYNF